MKKSLNKINIKLIIGSIFLVAGITSFSASEKEPGRLDTNFSESKFSENKSKSLNKIIDDNTPFPLSITRPLIKSSMEKAITSATSFVPLIGSILPSDKTVMDYNFYHYKESNGKQIAESFNETNKAVNKNTEEIQRLGFVTTINTNDIDRLSKDTNRLKKENEFLSDDIQKLSSVVDSHKQINEMKTQALYNTIYNKVDEEANERERTNMLIIADVGRVENKVEANIKSIENLDKNAKKDREEVQKNFKNLSNAVLEDIANEASARRAGDMAIMNEVQSLSSTVESNTRAIEHLNKKVASGLASVAAMTTIDNISNGRAGDVNIGAAVGGFEGTQAVAVGVAYSPTDNLNFVTKVGVNPGRARYTTYGAGVNYRFNLNR